VIFRGDPGALLRLEIGRGEWIYFFGCIAHALYIPLVRKLSRGEPQLVMTFGTLMAGFLVLAVWSGPEIVATRWLSLPPLVWFTLFYLAFVASAATLFLLQYASMRLPSAKVMAYTYLVPVWVIVLEGAIGHGWPAPMILVGVGLVATSLLLLLKE
jgi:drug/metabolite transporter (DMT)-like permease